MRKLSLVLFMLILTGCSILEQKFETYRTLQDESQLHCNPVTSLGNECAGFLIHEEE